MSVNLEQWISDHKIDEVECIVPDINGVQRGKVLPAKKFLASVKDKSLRIPGSVFICTIDGHYPEDIDDISGWWWLVGAEAGLHPIYGFVEAKYTHIVANDYTVDVDYFGIQGELTADIDLSGMMLLAGIRLKW